MKANLQKEFGNIDIYLFDQLLKGTYADCKNVIDIGCGSGRNLCYFLQNDFEVFGTDRDVMAIEEVKKLSKQLAPANNEENFTVALVEELPFKDNTFDLAICNAVLHFAQGEKHFDQMIRSVWRVLKPGGFLFARLASSIGIENLIVDLGDQRFYLPDGSERFLVNEQMLLYYTSELNGELYEYIKTTNVQNLRCMTTWCIKKKW